MDRRNQLILDVCGLALFDWSVMEYASLNLEKELEARQNKWLATADQISAETIIDLLYQPPISTETGMTPEEFQSAISELLGLIAMRLPQEVLPRMGALMNDKRIRRSILNAFASIEKIDTLPWLTPAINEVNNLTEDEQVHLVLAVMNNEAPERLLILQGMEQRIPVDHAQVHKVISEFHAVLK